MDRTRQMFGKWNMLQSQHCHNQSLVTRYAQGESSHRAPAKGSARVVCSLRCGRKVRQKLHSSDNEDPRRFYYLSCFARHGL
jgi:hypothetical protein